MAMADSGHQVSGLVSRDGAKGAKARSSADGTDFAEPETLNLKLGTLNWRAERMASFGNFLSHGWNTD